MEFVGPKVKAPGQACRADPVKVQQIRKSITLQRALPICSYVAPHRVYSNPKEHSPNQLQRKLDLPRRSLGWSNKPCAIYTASCRIEYVSVVQGRGKIRVIQNVEKLGPELCIEAIRDPFDVVVLEQREIEVH